MCLLKVRYSYFISASYRLRLDHMHHAFFMIVAQHMGEDFDHMYIANENGYLKNAAHHKEGKVITASGERAFIDVEKHFRGRHGFDGRLLHLQCWLSTENEEDFPIYST